MTYELSELKPVTFGGEKWIYQHPDSADLLIKVWRQKHFDSLKKKHPLLFKLKRFPRYSAILNEITEHLAVREQEKDARFIQTICGLTDTDRGPGLVVEAVRKKDGTLADTLQHLLQNRLYEDLHANEINRLFKWMLTTDVIIRDFSLNNLIWDEINEHFVIIDGIGSKPFISLRPLCRRYNKRANINRVNKLKSRISRYLNP